MNKLKVFGNVENKVIDRTLIELEVEIKPNEEIYIPENGYSGFKEVSVEGYSDKLESIEITPTREKQVFVPSEDKIGYSEVVVKPMDKSLKFFIDERKNAQYLFSDFNNMTDEQLAEFIPTYDTTSNVTNINSMFQNCNALTSAPQFDTSKVTNARYTFYNCINLTSVLQFNLSACTDTTSMFGYCNNLTNVSQLIINSASPNMQSMFSRCEKLQKVDISMFNIWNTNYTSYWFQNCYSLKSLIIRKFGGSRVLNSNAFSGCHHILGIQSFPYNPTGAKDGYIYVPRDMISVLSNSTNWSAYASQFRALEDYTVDGTTTGEFIEEKDRSIPYTENLVLYADGIVENRTVILEGNVIDTTLIL